MKTVPREMAAAVAGVVTLMGVQLGTSLSLFVAAIAGTAVYGALKLVIARTPDDAEVILTPGFTQEQLNAFVDYGLDQAEAFRLLAAEISDEELSGRVLTIGKCLDDIFQLLQQRPSSAQQAASVLGSHIDRARALIEQYADLDRNRTKLSSAAARQLTNAGTVIHTIGESFQGQLQGLLEDDVQVFQVASSSMSTILSMDSRRAALGGEERK